MERGRAGINESLRDGRSAILVQGYAIAGRGIQESTGAVGGGHADVAVFDPREQIAGETGAAPAA